MFYICVHAWDCHHRQDSKLLCGAQYLLLSWQLLHTHCASPHVPVSLICKKVCTFWRFVSLGQSDSMCSTRHLAAYTQHTYFEVPLY